MQGFRDEDVPYLKSIFGERSSRYYLFDSEGRRIKDPKRTGPDKKTRAELKAAKVIKKREEKRRSKQALNRKLRDGDWDEIESQE